MSHDTPDATQPVDLHALLDELVGQGSVWTHAGGELNINLVAWPEGGGVGEHINSEVEVLVVGVEGDGIVIVAGQEHPVHPGIALIIPKGARRAIRANSSRFAYLSIHRRRAGLSPVIHA